MKVLLIDDHPLILTALQVVVAGLSHGTEVSSAESAAQAREQMRRVSNLDLVLLDLRLGDADGFDLLAELRQEHPLVPVVVVSASEHVGDVVRSLDLGAMGYVPKRSSNQALVDALRVVLSGGIFVPQHLFGPQRGGPGPTLPPVPSAARLGLTPRQVDVLSCLLRGLPNKLVARELDLSVETVKDHVAAILRALNVNTRTQAVLVVAQMAQGRPDAITWRRGPQG